MLQVEVEAACYWRCYINRRIYNYKVSTKYQF